MLLSWSWHNQPIGGLVILMTYDYHGSRGTQLRDTVWRTNTNWHLGHLSTGGFLSPIPSPSGAGGLREFGVSKEWGRGFGAAGIPSVQSPTFSLDRFTGSRPIPFGLTLEVVQYGGLVTLATPPELPPWPLGSLRR